MFKNRVFKHRFFKNRFFKNRFSRKRFFKNRFFKNIFFVNTGDVELAPAAGPGKGINGTLPYIYREREREIQRDVYIYIYIYILTPGICRQEWGGARKQLPLVIPRAGCQEPGAGRRVPGDDGGGDYAQFLKNMCNLCAIPNKLP